MRYRKIIKICKLICTCVFFHVCIFLSKFKIKTLMNINTRIDEKAFLLNKHFNNANKIKIK